MQVELTAVSIAADCSGVEHVDVVPHACLGHSVVQMVANAAAKEQVPVVGYTDRAVVDGIDAVQQVEPGRVAQGGVSGL